MRTQEWLARWQEGRIGWHEPGGNANFRALWPVQAASRRVLVPLCGKTPDMRWLAEHGFEVTGVELSPLAVDAFFSENELPYTQGDYGGLSCYRAEGLPLTVCIGDYFAFHGCCFDALYDRGALVAVPPDRRPHYAAHTDSLLCKEPLQLLITLEYDQQVADGPPYSVLAEEVRSYWPRLRRMHEHNDIDNCPPKFRAAGLETVTEVAWSTL